MEIYELPSVDAVDPELIWNSRDIYEYSELQALKKLLNATKDEIETVDITAYAKFSDRIYPYSALKGELKNRASDDMTKKMVSKAYMKIRELMSLTAAYFANLDPGQHITTFHIAEAPGAFVPSIQSFLNNYNLYWEWYAESYVDIYTPRRAGRDSERYFGDHFGFMSATSRHWLRGSDGDGDITSPANLLSFNHMLRSPKRTALAEEIIQRTGVSSAAQNSRKRGGNNSSSTSWRVNTSMHTETQVKRAPVRSAGRDRGFRMKSGSLCDLVTSDVKMVPADNDFGEEENQNYAVQLGHICAALLLCKPGGMAILKHFTFFEASSISMLYILCSFFERVCAVKPLTSTHTNSEIYLVCLGYRATKKPEAIERLLKALGEIRFLSACYIPLLPSSVIPAEFVTSIEKCMTAIVARQRVALDEVLGEFKKYSAAPEDYDFAKVSASQKKLAAEWMEEYI